MLQTAGVDKRKGQPVNFFIRAHYANRSRDDLMDLYKKLNDTNTVTFTLYSDDQYYFKGGLMPLNIQEVKDAIRFFSPEKSYLQVSDEIRAALELNGLSNPRVSINSALTIDQWSLLLLIVFSVVNFVGNFVFHKN